MNKSNLTNNKPILSIPQKTNAFMLVKKKLQNKQSLKSACEDVVLSMNLPVTSEALRATIRRMINADGKIHKKMIFDCSTEELFVGIIESFSLINRPLGRIEFISFVKTLISNPDEWDYRGWLDNFLERHKHRISLKSSTSITTERISFNLIYSVETFINIVRKWILDDKINIHHIFNADETRLNFYMEKNKIKKIVHVSKNINNVISGGRLKAASYIPFVNNEKILFSVIILPLKQTYSLYSLEYYMKFHQHPVYFGFSKSGFVNTSLWFLIIKKFNELFEKQNPSQQKYIFLDKLNIHMDIEIIKFCIQNNMKITYLPVGSTHFLQPCDNLIFLSMKRHLKKQLGKELISTGSNSRSIGSRIVDMVIEAENNITSNIIKKSWENVGIIPFNELKIKSNLDKNIGIVNEDNESQISLTYKKMMTDNLTNLLNLDYHEVVHPNDATDELLDFEDILKYKIEKIKNKNLSNSNKNNGKMKHNKKKNLSKSMIKRNIQNFVCSSIHHNKLKWPKINNITSWEHCSKCNSYAFCSYCYADQIEEFIQHEEICQRKKSKSSKNREKS